MEQILVYGDSLSWGIIPNTRERLVFEKRWPGVCEKTLEAAGHPVRVIENCLNGRRTAWDDPFKAGRNGSIGLAQVIELNAPLQLVILALGTNDFQSTHQNDIELAAQGVAKLVRIVRQAPVEPGMPVPQVMILAPPPILAPKGVMATKFAGAVERSAGFALKLAEVAGETGTLFFDAGGVTDASSVDGIHLDADQHVVLGKAVARHIEEIGILVPSP